MPLVFWWAKKHLPVDITRHVTRQFNSVTRFGTGIAIKRWASVTDVGPAKNPTLVQCLVLAVFIAIIGLEHCWASVNVEQWWESDGNLLYPN